MEAMLFDAVDFGLELQGYDNPEWVNIHQGRTSTNRGEIQRKEKELEENKSYILIEEKKKEKKKKLRSKRAPKSELKKAVKVTSVRSLKREFGFQEIHEYLTRETHMGGTGGYSLTGYGFSYGETEETRMLKEIGKVSEVTILEGTQVVLQEKEETKNWEVFKAGGYVYEEGEQLDFRLHGRVAYALLDGLIYNRDRKEYYILDAKLRVYNQQSQIRYIIQMQWYMHVTGIRKAYVAHYKVGGRVELELVERDEEMIELLLNSVHDVLADRNPQIKEEVRFRIDKYMRNKRMEGKTLGSVELSGRSQEIQELKAKVRMQEYELKKMKEQLEEKTQELMYKVEEQGGVVVVDLDNGRMKEFKVYEKASGRASLDKEEFAKMLIEKGLGEYQEEIDKIKHSCEFRKKKSVMEEVEV